MQWIKSGHPSKMLIWTFFITFLAICLIISRKILKDSRKGRIRCLQNRIGVHLSFWQHWMLWWCNGYKPIFCTCEAFLWVGRARRKLFDVCLLWNGIGPYVNEELDHMCTPFLYVAKTCVGLFIALVKGKTPRTHHCCICLKGNYISAIHSSIFHFGTYVMHL